ncbi:hypothetical protein Salat_2899300 [Sesamum alatum]|uniref:RNase H type-1 domain-containing protein n=1 Tax=Sesamum alatum TaxID=300844 RepID=A0AAE1XID9_9LAMI|nr:hypothetical protein Salat_2899300 [Sesamum alatum]
MLCWSLWGRRNKQVMESSENKPDVCVAMTNKLLSDFLNAVTVNRPSPPTTGKWEAPGPGEIKVNFDTSVLSNKKCVYIEAIARDHLGRCVAWRKDFHADITDPEHSEALAARLVVELCRSFSWNSCILEADYLRVVQKL